MGSLLTLLPPVYTLALSVFFFKIVLTVLGALGLFCLGRDRMRGADRAPLKPAG